MEELQKVLAGKVAIVTGAGRGIGRAIALAYGAAGARVCCAARTIPEIEDTMRQIARNGGRALAVETDVSSPESVHHLIETTVSDLGGLDILVINAGVHVERSVVEESDPDAWQQTLDINLTGAYLCAQAAIPHLKARGGGKIITVGSGMGHHGTTGSAAYACSKAGLWMLTRVLAQELWQYKISVNELIPGPVETLLSDARSDDSESVFQIESEWIKGPEDVAPLALFLATQPLVGPSAQSFSLMRRDNG